jgi:tight adherence protein B
MENRLISLLIPLLFAMSIGGLVYAMLEAAYAGAEHYSGAYSEEVARQFEDIFLFIPPKRIADAGWAAAAMAFIVVFLLAGNLETMQGVVIGVLFGGIAAVFALMAPWKLLALLRRRRLNKFNQQLVDTLISMSNALKAGFSIMQAFESVVKDGENPIAQEFDVFLQQTRVGVSFSEALVNMEKRVGSEDLSLVVVAIETARKTGGNLTEVFERIASTIRERMRIENRIKTLTAQGRFQGIIVSLMPVIIAAAMSVVNPGMMVPFFQSLTGAVCVGVVVLLIFIGWLMIRRIIKIDV